MRGGAARRQTRIRATADPQPKPRRDTVMGHEFTGEEVGRLDPSPSIGATIGLDEVPDAIGQVRKAQGPPRIVVHPAAS